MAVLNPVPGAVLCVRTSGFDGFMIRFGAALVGASDMFNHIAVLSHKDKNGTWWAIEGRPGGVGWVDAASYLNQRFTISNELELANATDDQVLKICSAMQGLLGVPYDWRAIGEDALRDLHIDDVWGEKWQGNVAPGHVVCSSLAAYTYHAAGLPAPSVVDVAHIQPGDWADFIIENNYQ